MIWPNLSAWVSHSSIRKACTDADKINNFIMISWKTSAPEVLGQQWAAHSFRAGFPFSDSERITGLELSQLLQLKQTTLNITMVSWKTGNRRLYMECWAYNDMAQSFTEGFFFLISLERSLKTIMIHRPGLPWVSSRQWAGPMRPN